MRAVIARRYGGPEVLEIVEVPTPEPGPGQVRIAVAAAAVNPVDGATRSGYLDHFVQGRLPVGLGWDVAGTVDALGPDVDDLSLRRPVIALLDQVVTPFSGYASHVIAPWSAVSRAPAGVDPVAAATLPLNASTAAQALDLLDLEPGQTLLVTGAAGGVGEYTVALAARRGLKVVGLARAADEADVLGAGATQFVASIGDVAEVDGALDAAMLGPAALAVVRDGGRYIAVNDPAMPVAERGIDVRTVHVRADGALLEQLVDDVEAGLLRLRVAATYPLDDAGAAQARLEAGGVRGRLVLVP